MDILLSNILLTIIALDGWYRIFSPLLYKVQNYSWYCFQFSTISIYVG